MERGNCDYNILHKFRGFSIMLPNFKTREKYDGQNYIWTGAHARRRR
jgi:hypothetical protein